MKGDVRGGMWFVGSLLVLLLCSFSAEPGEFSILAGRSSADIKLQGKYLLTNGQETY